jgi:uncharacterized protein with HEPN domain
MLERVVHDYLGVDEDIVWQVVTVDLPPLIVSLETVRAARSGSDESGLST